jgi:predicted phosphodiesterase
MFLTASDLHTNENKPAFRIENDWIEVCLGKLGQLLAAAKEKKCPVIINGDFFERYAHSPELVNRVLDMIKGVEIIIIPGNHDMKNHSLDLLKKSSIWTLSFAGATIIEKPSSIAIHGTEIDLFPFGSELKSMGGRIAIIHEFAFQEKPWKDCNPAGNYKRIIKRLEAAAVEDSYELIIAGDNHADFIAEFHGCTFLNCGAMLRTDKDEQDRKPAFYLVDDDLKITRIPFKIEQEVFDQQAINIITKKDEAISRVADQISKDWRIELNFKRNIQKRIDQADLDEEVIELIKEIAL